MAVIGITSLDAIGAVTATVVTASASDTFTYTKGAGMTIVMDNTTGGSLTLNLKGSAPSAAYPVVGTGETKDLTAGYSVVVAAGQKKVLDLDKISAYLVGSGAVTCTGAATLKLTVYK